MEGGDDMAVWCVWLAVFVVCIGLEAASMALTSIWFAGGALIACVLSIAGVNLYIQMAVFVVVSFLLCIQQDHWHSGISIRRRCGPMWTRWWVKSAGNRRD